MKPLSIYRQIENTQAAIAMVNRLQPEQFVSELRTWQHKPTIVEHVKSFLTTLHPCGAAFCLGGWVAQEPFFQKQGVLATDVGSPYLPSLDLSPEFWLYSPSFAAAAYLFGCGLGERGYMTDASLFARASLEEMYRFPNEKVIVLERLTNHLAKLRVKHREFVLGLVNAARESVLNELEPPIEAYRASLVSAGVPIEEIIAS